MPTRIACVDDQPELLRSLSEALAEFEETELSFTATGHEDFFSKLKQARLMPEVILMDIEMHHENGIDLTAKIHDRWPSLKILMLTVVEDSEQIFKALLAGASGYLLKGEKPVKIVQAIEDVKEGRIPLSPSVAAKALQWMRQQQPGVPEIAPEEFGVSARELEILELVATGITYRQIAEKLFISPKTVRNHIENIFSKLNVHSKIEAVKFAREKRWLE